MIPAVEDFTQRQQLLLESRRLQDAQSGQFGQSGDGQSGQSGGEGDPERLLGKLLVSPEELREKLLVGGF